MVGRGAFRRSRWRIASWAAERCYFSSSAGSPSRRCSLTLPDGLSMMKLEPAVIVASEWVTGVPSAAAELESTLLPPTDRSLL